MNDHSGIVNQIFKCSIAYKTRRELWLSDLDPHWLEYHGLIFLGIFDNITQAYLKKMDILCEDLADLELMLFSLIQFSLSGFY